MTIATTNLHTAAETEIKERSLLTIRQFSAKHQAFTEGGLRHLIFHAESNGFHTVIRRVGRRILIAEANFFDWVDKQNQPNQR